MEQKKFLTLLAISMLLMTCSSAELRVNSSPSEAKVTLISRDGQKEELGLTPLTKARKSLNTRGPFLIEIQKEGFETKNIFVPDSFYQSQIILQTLMNKPQQSVTTSPVALDGNKIVREISVIHNLIQRKEFSEAQSKLVNLTTDFPGYSALWSLLGNVYFLQRKWDQAYDAYTRASDLDPNAADVRSMLERLKSLKGGG